MMAPEQSQVAFLAVTALVLVVPGPSVAFAAGRGYEHGVRVGLSAVLGLETGLLLHVLAAAAGLSAVVAATPGALTGLRWAGALYLAWLGVRALLGPEPAPQPAAPRASTTGGCARVFREGLVVDLVNPKTVLFVLALMPQFAAVSGGPGVTRSLLLGGVVVGLALLVDGSYAVAAALLGRRSAGGSTRLASLATAAAFLGLAVLALVG